MNGLPMALRDDFPAVFTFFSSHFHQDWNHEYSDAEDVIRTYILECGMAEREQISAELKALLSLELSPGQFEKLIWWELCCEYVPTADGWADMRVWVEHVRDEFARSLRRGEERQS